MEERQSGAGAALAVAEFREQLTRRDLEGLSDLDRLDLLRELELLTRAAAGVSVRTQTAFHASQVAAQVQAGVAPSRAGRAVPDDLARARRTSPYWGSRELTSAKALVTEMPRTLAALQDGTINLHQARVVTEATTCLEPGDRAEVDSRLAGMLAGASTGEIGAAVRGLVYEVDPKGFVERARKAAKDRGVSMRPTPDVMALLTARLPAAQAIACYAALKEKATALRASGDPRTLAQLMADELFARLTGRTVVDGVDVEVNVVITDSALFDGTSEAADLVGYGPIPAETARDLLRPDSGSSAETEDAQDPGGERQDIDDPTAEPEDQQPELCPDGIRCTSWSCPSLHGESAAGSPPAPAPSGPAASAEPGLQAAPQAPKASSAATTAATVWLRRLWADPVTGVLTGRDTRKRLFTGSLRAALIARDRTCRNTWCGAPIRAIDHKVPARHSGPTSDTNGQGLCQRCNNAREHPRATPPDVDEYRSAPALLPGYLFDRAPPAA